MKEKSVYVVRQRSDPPPFPDDKYYFVPDDFIIGWHAYWLGLPRLSSPSGWSWNRGWSEAEKMDKGK